MRIKTFENYSIENQDQLYDIFESIDLDYDVKVSILSLFDTIYFVKISFENKVKIENILKIMWEKINLARNMGYDTYSGFETASGGDRGIYGKIDLSRTFGRSGNYDLLQIKISDRTFTSDLSDPSNPLNDPRAKFPQIFKDLDIYSKIDKTYKVSNIGLYFDC